MRFLHYKLNEYIEWAIMWRTFRESATLKKKENEVYVLMAVVKQIGLLKC